MLGRWRKEGEGLFPTGTSPTAMHLPGRLRKAPSPTLDSTLKPKGPVSRGLQSRALLCHTDATGTFGQRWKPGHLRSALTQLPN